MDPIFQMQLPPYFCLGFPNIWFNSVGSSASKRLEICRLSNPQEFRLRLNWVSKDLEAFLSLHFRQNRRLLYLLFIRLLGVHLGLLAW